MTSEYLFSLTAQKIFQGKSWAKPRMQQTTDRAAKKRLENNITLLNYSALQYSAIR